MVYVCAFQPPDVSHPLRSYVCSLRLERLHFYFEGRFICTMFIDNSDFPLFFLFVWLVLCEVVPHRVFLSVMPNGC